MTNTRWWTVVVIGGVLVCLAILFGNDLQPVRLIAGSVVLALFLAAWFAIGRRAVCAENQALAYAYIIVLIVLSAAAAFVHPSLATLQTVTYPLVWILAGSTARAVVANVVTAIVVGTGYFLSYGPTLRGLGEAAIVAALSLTFSLAMGLWISRIFQTSNERQALIEKLSAAQDDIAALSRDSGITSERERLAREIHDTIAQDLTGIVLLAQRVSRELSAGDTASAGSQLVLLEENARTALAETRALVAASAPPSLEAGGIAGALERLGERFERETAIAVSVLADVNEPIERDLEVVLLRSAQEGLANVRKHSGASRVSVRLNWGAERSLQVSDNGAGFELGAATDGYGLRGLRDRLALAGGTLDVESGEDGTTLLVTLP